MACNVLSVVGARPNFMKVGPLHRALERHGGFVSRIIHTGQHYDERMSDIFFRQLELPEPDFHLGVGSDTHARQTARVMIAFEEVLEAERPDLVIVVGDVNSTLACALVAAKRHVPLAHVEAGLRSFDRRMPEEINRLLTDRLADHLFVTEESGVENLRAEGIPEDRIHLVGNVMIDSLVRFREKAAALDPLGKLGLAPGSYVLVTMHRPSNVDSREALLRWLPALERVAEARPVVFPCHVRTRERLAAFGLEARLEGLPSFHLLEPLGYLEFLRLMEEAGAVVTDSGGIQEETTFLGVPCLTLRETTERPVTVELGTNRLVPLEPEAIAAAIGSILDGDRPPGKRPPLWDGRTAERIVEVAAGALLAPLAGRHAVS